MLQRLKAALKTLRARFIVIVALCWLLPMMILGIYMSGSFMEALKAKTEQALQSGLVHAEDLVVKEIERVLKKSKDITYDEVIYNNYTAYKNGTLDYESFYAASRSYWQRLFQRERSMPFTAFYFLDEPWRMVYTSASAAMVRTFNENVKPDLLLLGETLDTRSRFASVEGRLYLVRNLYNRKLERFGMAVMEIEPGSLFAPLTDPASIWQGKTDIKLDDFELTSNDTLPQVQEDAPLGLLENKGSITYTGRRASSDYHLSYRVSLDRSLIFGQLDQYYRLLWLLIALFIPSAALIMVLIHRWMTRPLARLAKASRQMAEGELGVTVAIQGPDEIGALGRSFNAMSSRIKQLIDRSYKEELALRDARISALQSRINPHFMNNALEMMNWQARMEGSESVGQMIEALSTLLNAALDRSNQRTVPLRFELEVADAYFYFIRQRFAQRVRIEKNIDSSLLERPVPPMAIQTLIENAVEHGISPAGGGTVRLNVYEKDHLLIIEVRNDGTPLDSQQQEKINTLLTGAEDAQDGHLGLRNVSQRLKLIYHGQASLTVRAAQNGETLACMRIPESAEETAAQRSEETA